MPRAAVLGSPIEHSLSPVLHNAGYEAAGLEDWDYTRFETAAEALPDLVRRSTPEFVGFSVTMPGKFAALRFADTVSERAQLIGSANTLVRKEEGWFADNTDTEGVRGALIELLGDSPARHAMLIGAGGTARPALWALAERGVSTVTVLNRSDRSAELRPLAQELGLELSFTGFDGDLSALSRAADVIVSTVPAAAVEDYVFDIAHAPVLDVIYDPWPTPLTTCAAANGYKSVGGHIMLAYQAFSQFEQFTGVAAPREEMLNALNKELQRRSQTVK
ncbi:shikimate dehydrogenase [Corynebacterium kefirresidentii]|uniref:shikimate dehydrogenase n=1 Tax=Corynebacterium kefirresidentii TaxID=1979527 RepID=UPI0038D13E70